MRIGVLGGTFNPIHNAHLAMGECAFSTLALDKVLMMVSADPPHKDVADRVAAEERLHMVELACRGSAALEPCALELEREGKSYTADTLALLKARYGASAQLYLIIGSDSLQEFSSWRRPEEIARLAELAVAPRPGRELGDGEAARRLRESLGARVTFLPPCAEDISSTRIRSCVEDALPVGGLLPEAVEEWIYLEGVYFPEAIRGIQRRLRVALTPSRYAHTMSTVRQAVRLARMWGADAQKARLAALLHDCAKNMDGEALTAISRGASHISAVEHAFAGAVVASRDYGVDDPQVLQAIRLHCTGDAGMTLLDQVVYLADATEPARTYPHVEDYRAALALGPEEAMKRVLAGTEAHIRRQGGQMHPATLRAIEYFQSRGRGAPAIK